MAELNRVARDIMTVPDEKRVRPLQRLAEHDDFPYLLAGIIEFEEDLARSVSDYNRSEQERTMDAGGLASIRKLREVLEATISYVEPTDPPAPAETLDKK